MLVMLSSDGRRGHGLIGICIIIWTLVEVSEHLYLPGIIPAITVRIWLRWRCQGGEGKTVTFKHIANQVRNR